MTEPSRPSAAANPVQGTAGWLAVVAAGLAVFMTTFDMTAVAIALPDLTRDMGVSPASGELLILAYAGAMVALGLPAGRYVDGADVRGCFTVGALGFAAASLLAGLATSFEVLLGARVVQGLFGALIAAVVPVIATGALPPEQRGRALSIIGTLGPLGALTGPALGGPLVEWFGWPSVFYVVVPFSLGAVVLAARTLNRQRSMPLPQAGLALEALVVGGCFLCLFAVLTILGTPSRTQGAPVLVALSAGAVALLFIWTRLPGFQAVRAAVRQPMVAACVVSLGLATTASGALYYLPPFALEMFYGWTPSQIGLVLLFQPLAMGLVGPLAGYLADIWNAWTTAMLGLGSMVVGAALLVVGVESWGMPGIIGCLLLTGTGLGLFAGPNQTLLMTAAPPHLRGTSAASSGLARQMGLGMGAALATILWLGGATTVSEAGLSRAFLVAPAAALLALLAFALLAGRAARERDPEAPPTSSPSSGPGPGPELSRQPAGRP